MIFNDLLTKIDNSRTLDAEHINEGMKSAQHYLNNGITSRQLENKQPSAHPVFENEGWVTSEHIYKPEFYGSPSPRMMAVSGQTHFREVNNSVDNGSIFCPPLSGSGQTGIPNACTRIKLRHDAEVFIMASFYCFEFGGINEEMRVDVKEDYWSTSTHTGGYEMRRAGSVYLDVDGVGYNSTRRQIFSSTIGGRRNDYTADPRPDETNFAFFHSLDPFLEGWEHGGYAGWLAINGFIEFPMIGRHQHTIQKRFFLEKGIHDIGLVLKPRRSAEAGHRLYTYFGASVSKYGLEDRPSFPLDKFIFFQATNFIVDAYYTDFDPE